MPEYLLILIRSIFAFLVLHVMTRLMGKKQLSQLTFFDYVVGITIGSIAADLSVDQGIPTLNGLVGILVWGIFPILLSFLDLKSYRIRHMNDGNPTVLIENGQILEKNLKKERITMDELMALLREKNAFKLQDVELAILETNGQLSVMKKADAQPVTPKDLHLPVEMEHEPRVVIIDGNVMERTLGELGYSKDWLLAEVRKQGAKGLEDVFFAQADSKGNVYADLYRDERKKPPVQEKALIMATLKKTQADLELFALETQNRKAKQMYQQLAQEVEQLGQQLAPYLKDG